MAIEMDPSLGSVRDQVDVKIVWKGRRIAKLIFPSGKIVEFNESAGLAKLRVVDADPDKAPHSSNSPKILDVPHDR